MAYGLIPHMQTKQSQDIENELTSNKGMATKQKKEKIGSC